MSALFPRHISCFMLKNVYIEKHKSGLYGNAKSSSLRFLASAVKCRQEMSHTFTATMVSHAEHSSMLWLTNSYSFILTIF